MKMLNDMLYSYQKKWKGMYYSYLNNHTVHTFCHSQLKLYIRVPPTRNASKTLKARIKQRSVSTLNSYSSCSSLRLHCNKRDKAWRHKLKYFSGLFSLDADTGLLTTQRDLTGRGRTEPYRLLAEANDGVHSAVTSLLLYVGDVSANDGVPAFVAPGVGDVLTVSEVCDVTLTII